MWKKIGLISIVLTLSACSMPSLPKLFQGDSEEIIKEQRPEKIDQKSYATAYEATLQTYHDRVGEHFYVNQFNKGVQDWFADRILIPVNTIREKISQGGHDSKNYAYFSGVLFASDLQTNFQRLGNKCWQAINIASLSIGIQDAMQDLKQHTAKSQDDPYLQDGTQQLLPFCIK